eukprot:763594-Hanusia_phi.AAC.3
MPGPGRGPGPRVSRAAFGRTGLGQRTVTRIRRAGAGPGSGGRCICKPLPGSLTWHEPQTVTRRKSSRPGAAIKGVKNPWDSHHVLGFRVRRGGGVVGQTETRYKQGVEYSVAGVGSGWRSDTEGHRPQSDLARVSARLIVGMGGGARTGVGLLPAGRES